ncbi:MAG TPA: adenylate/guanylate cyclase domain-containing protein [Methylomirabilota bacterium]|nr:adenylate/guanylate cyclase domain-containing protein [Methylomirabilota bacterium]
MQCPRCQHENPREARFCEECATPLAPICANCRTALSATAKFCHACAHPVASVGGTPSRAPDSYTPRSLAEKILTSKAALEGERKQVTVLFADLKGSMELLADRDPEEARKILDPVLEQMMEAVHRYEGTVNQVMGDGIMALFGAPIAHEDHAVRACYAALRMQEVVHRYSGDLRRAQGVEVQIRIGLNSGEVVVRSIGSDLRMDYTAVGQTTHLAARMEQLATPGTVRLTGETMRLVEGYVEVRSLGPIPVKGLSDLIEIFELTGAGQARTRLQAAALRGLTRFVGRDAEVEHLRRVLGQADAGHGQVAAIVGEAGVGKSRLTYEFTHSHRVRDWLILEASSVSYGKATSYLPVIGLLKGYFKIGDRDDLREIREKVTGKLLTLDRGLEPALTTLLALLDVPIDDRAWQTLDPLQRRQRTLDALKRLLLREARERTLLVIFEDLHWIDRETQALLDGLVESLSSARLLLLVNYRPEYQHGWGSKTFYSQMRLDALPIESAGELLEALLGNDPGLSPLKQLLVKRGNPFFLEETVRTLVETKALVGERGRYRLTQPLQALQVPPTVQTVLAARIDRLSPGDKRLLQVASVIGKDVPFMVLQAIAELPDEALRGALGRLQTAEFLYESGLFPDLEYSFKHALTHDVTYGGLLLERRRQLHARIVAAIEMVYRDRLAEHVERLAHHAGKGERWDSALVYCHQSGLKAFVRSAYREAAAWLEEALAVAARLSERQDVVERAVDIRLDLRRALLPLGQSTQILARLWEAEGLARRLEDPQRLGWVKATLTHHFWQTGKNAEASQHGEEAVDLARTAGDSSLEIAASYYLAIAKGMRAQYREAEALCVRIIGLVGDDVGLTVQTVVPPPASGTRCVLNWICTVRGDFVEGARHGSEALRIAETLGHHYSVMYALMGLAYLHAEKGDVGSVFALGERGLAVGREAGIAYHSSRLMNCLGFAKVLSGSVDDGIALLRTAMRDHEMMGLRTQFARMLVYLAQGLLLSGRLGEAESEARRAYGVAVAGEERWEEAMAGRLLGEIAALRHPQSGEIPSNHYQRALSIATEIGARPLVAHCHLGLGKLYHRRDKPEQAQQHLTTATAMYRDMGMTYWLEKAEAEMQELA